MEPEISLLCFHYCVLRNLPLILSQINSMHVTAFCFFVIHLMLPSHLSLGFTLFPSFPPKEPRVPFFLPHTPIYVSCLSPDMKASYDYTVTAGADIRRRLSSNLRIGRIARTPHRKKSCDEMIHGTLGFLGQIGATCAMECRLNSGRSQSLFLSIRRAIQQTVVNIDAYHS